MSWDSAEGNWCFADEELAESGVFKKVEEQ